MFRVIICAFCFAVSASFPVLADVAADLKIDTHVLEDRTSDVVAMIHKEAARQGVPAEFAIKVAKRESGLRCNAYNKNGATSGLYQLKAATARGLGFQGNTSELLTCNAGLVFGMKHLAICWRLANGNAARADYCHRAGFRAISNREATIQEMLTAEN